MHKVEVRRGRDRKKDMEDHTKKKEKERGKNDKKKGGKHLHKHMDKDKMAYMHRTQADTEQVRLDSILYVCVLDVRW